MFYTLGSIFFFVSSILLVALVMLVFLMMRSVIRFEKKMTEKMDAIHNGLDDLKSNFVGVFFSSLGFIMKMMNRKK